MIEMKSISQVKRNLRHHGMRECYTPGGANILYCHCTAIRLINDYTIEVWDSFNQSSGTITHYDTPTQRNEAIELMGLESLGVI